MNEPIIIIVGPTAVGKSALAVSIAKRINGEVISADSRQVYKKLNIGTGKITTREMRGIPHHLLNCKSPRQTYTAADFVRDASTAITTIQKKGRVPIICGGTGFYIDALVGRITLADSGPDKALRLSLESQSTEELFEQLQKRDPVRAASIDKHNKRRLVRALEIAEHPAPAPTTQKTRPDALWVGLTLPKETLRERIHTRLNERMRRGMVAEARRLHEDGLSYKRMHELGLEYRYLAQFLAGTLSKAEMLAKLEPKIWQFAKRQMTYWRRNKTIRWFSPNDTRAISESVDAYLRVHGAQKASKKRT